MREVKQVLRMEKTCPTRHLWPRHRQQQAQQTQAANSGDIHVEGYPLCVSATVPPHASGKTTRGCTPTTPGSKPRKAKHETQEAANLNQEKGKENPKEGSEGPGEGHAGGLETPGPREGDLGH